MPCVVQSVYKNVGKFMHTVAINYKLLALLPI